MAEPESNWRNATTPRCPHCGETRMVEPLVIPFGTWLCNVCSKTFIPERT